jgi:hypothetical protein
MSKISYISTTGLVSTILLTGCGTVDFLKNNFSNDLACSLGDPQAWVISEYGPIGIASKIKESTSKKLCPVS